uniref:Uncharacterized protein n=1 Tax=Oryza punctata TaxID=4537 RepID=A0A0E0K0A4_ORYPU
MLGSGCRGAEEHFPALPIIDDDASAQQPEVDAQSAAVSLKRRLIHKNHQVKQRKHGLWSKRRKKKNFNLLPMNLKRRKIFSYADGSSNHELDELLGVVGRWIRPMLQYQAKDFRACVLCLLGPIGYGCCPAEQDDGDTIFYGLKLFPC